MATPANLPQPDQLVRDLDAFIADSNWQFVKEEDGVQIYSMAVGDKKVRA